MALRESLPLGVGAAASHGLGAVEVVVEVHGLGIGTVSEGGEWDGAFERGSVGSGVIVSVGELFDSDDFNVLETSENSGRGCA